jgi:hypothetical protein
MSLIEYLETWEDHWTCVVVLLVEVAVEVVVLCCWSMLAVDNLSLSSK